MIYSGITEQVNTNQLARIQDKNKKVHKASEGSASALTLQTSANYSLLRTKNPNITTVLLNL